MMQKGWKKGYFYTLDTVVGVIVLMIGLFIIAGIYFQSPEKERTEAISKDITGILSNIKVGDLCSDLSTCTCRYGSLSSLCGAGLSMQQEMSLMELFGLLYHMNQVVWVEAILNDTIIDQEILPLTHDMQILLQDPKYPGILNQLYPKT